MGLGRLAGWPLGAWAFVPALGVEAAWEILENTPQENTPFVIARYRAGTVAQGHTGDSVLNSLSDIAAMAAGFALAARLPAAASVLVGFALDAGALLAIRDNLTLNVLMLLHPFPAIRVWQAGA